MTFPRVLKITNESVSTFLISFLGVLGFFFEYLHSFFFCVCFLCVVGKRGKLEERGEERGRERGGEERGEKEEKENREENKRERGGGKKRKSKLAFNCKRRKFIGIVRS